MPMHEYAHGLSARDRYAAGDRQSAARCTIDVDALA